MTATCDMCGRERTNDDGDYNPVQILAGGRAGWYSGHGDEMCPACLVDLVRKANMVTR